MLRFSLSVLNGLFVVDPFQGVLWLRDVGPDALTKETTLDGPSLLASPSQPVKYIRTVSSNSIGFLVCISTMSRLLDAR